MDDDRTARAIERLNAQINWIRNGTLTESVPCLALDDLEALRDAIAKAQEALPVAQELSRYAAAPFFREAVRQRDEAGDVSYVQPTTEEWWEGLKELIERAQPLLDAALA